LSYNGEKPSQTAIYNPFSGTLYFRAVSISGRQICNFSDQPILLAGTVYTGKERIRCGIA
jgi:hypothetical protein